MFDRGLWLCRGADSPAPTAQPCSPNSHAAPGPREPGRAWTGERLAEGCRGQGVGAEVGSGGGAGETRELGGGRTAKRYWDIRIKGCTKKKAKVPQAQSWCYHPEHLHTIHAWEPKRASKTVPEYETPKRLGLASHPRQRRRGSVDLSLPLSSPADPGMWGYLSLLPMCLAFWAIAGIWTV